MRESRLAGENLVSDNFIGSVLSFPDWQQAKFSPGNINHSEARINEKWGPTYFQPAVKGL